ncbi:fimbrial protein [Rhodoferax aquaticus]|uniref:Type 1 fimbrial protein n=1 Tax=Rhodoferax aquaticus TaxID=2527691 RepID=A0A515ESX4_9BURK|nr:fimbrial protein [Rhodoferax aquaticus]QDL55765.1 type 1 fimbrial protein [Rhodoferax aquaticus]
MKILIFAILKILIGSFFYVGAIHAEQCTTGGPVTLEFSPPLPPQFVLTGRSNGDVLWSGTAIVRFNGCSFSGSTKTNPRVAFVVSTGGTPGKIIVKSGTNTTPTGLSINRSAPGAVVTGLPAGCVLEEVKDTIETGLTIYCSKPIYVTDLSAVMATIPNIKISVIDNRATSSTFGDPNVTLVTIAPQKWGYIMTVANLPFAYANFKKASNTDDITVIGGGVKYVIQATCTLSPANIAVPLPDVGMNSFRRVGDAAGTTPFNLNLTGCSNGNNQFFATSKWSFTPGASQNSIANAVTSGGAVNVETQLLDANQSPISNGGTVELGVVPAGGTQLSKGFFAQYIATGPVSPGSVVGIATFTINYR